MQCIHVIGIHSAAYYMSVCEQRHVSVSAAAAGDMTCMKVAWVSREAV